MASLTLPTHCGLLNLAFSAPCCASRPHLLRIMAGKVGHQLMQPKRSGRLPYISRCFIVTTYIFQSGVSTHCETPLSSLLAFLLCGAILTP